MKHIALILLIVLVLPGYFSVAQDADPYLKNIIVYQQEDNVYLRWTISAGNTCDGTIIERLDTTGAFRKFDEIPGVCGSPDLDITYEVVDTNPIHNRVNTYRLQLGLLGYSSPVSVEVIILNEEGYSVQPNPFRDRSLFIFENPDRLPHEFFLFDAWGQVVMKMSTSGDRINIDRNDLNSGTYIFLLMRGNTLKSTGKIVLI